MQYERETAKIRPPVHIPPPFKRCRRGMLIASLCAFHAEDSLFEEKRIGAIHCYGFMKLCLTYFVPHYFVNCAF